jgi:hypothetical protein
MFKHSLNSDGISLKRSVALLVATIESYYQLL